MKMKFFALFLALSLIAWAQAPQTPAANSTPNSSTAAEAKGCCHHAEMKGGCCHHAMGDMAKAEAKDAMACCGGNKCQSKDGKSCCSGKDIKACAEQCKKAGSCQESKCCSGGKGCCGESKDKTTAKCCSGNKCERATPAAAGN